MKILNRPMFRYGGPIKEGIMTGIREPKKQGGSMGAALVGNPAYPRTNGREHHQTVEQNANAFKIYTDEDFKVRDKFRKMDDKDFITNESIKDQFNKKNYINNQDVIPSSANDGLIDYTTDIISNKAYDKRNQIMSSPEAEKGYLKNFAIDSGMKEKMLEQQKNLKTFDPERYKSIYEAQDLKAKEILPKIDDKPLPVVGEGEGDEEKREKSVKGILEKLGYARSQKNALYDALIKGGQRISREGLGKEGLVNDLIMDTSTSYDKPEKIREAAELMQIQQDLKLEQINASRTNATEEAVNFLMSKQGGGMSRTEALDQVLKNPRSGLEAYQTAFQKLGAGSESSAVDSAIEWSVQRDKFDKPLGKINSKKYAKPEKFAGSKDWKGAGNYVMNGTVVFIDENGEHEIIETFYTSKKSNKFLGIFGSDD
tara:strand:+ start:667 stop:1947 length:1281 start_codon:yes stop_codon:yes gene_type:complete